MSTPKFAMEVRSTSWTCIRSARTPYVAKSPSHLRCFIKYAVLGHLQVGRGRLCYAENFSTLRRRDAGPHSSPMPLIFILPCPESRPYNYFPGSVGV